MAGPASGRDEVGWMARAPRVPRSDVLVDVDVVELAREPLGRVGRVVEGSLRLLMGTFSSLGSVTMERVVRRRVCWVVCVFWRGRRSTALPLPAAVGFLGPFSEAWGISPRAARRLVMVVLPRVDLVSAVRVDERVVAPAVDPVLFITGMVVLLPLLEAVLAAALAERERVAMVEVAGRAFSSTRRAKRRVCTMVSRCLNVWCLSMTRGAAGATREGRRKGEIDNDGLRWARRVVHEGQVNDKWECLASTHGCVQGPRPPRSKAAQLCFRGLGTGWWWTKNMTPPLVEPGGHAV